ncbi:hypothetical protein K490DRAFT_59009 [Saccharata proteae CBS 121410]|uniref:Homeobox domain-containing protein n=1 Tax=Saccharata proteae CBS 121410 TaxID=1314787 RepID=A0A9P4HSG6_9PEZI|nr:hypothetical protein K490DRAFT_59009 [Saccharata proteae CBS 121410]
MDRFSSSVSSYATRPEPTADYHSANGLVKTVSAPGMPPHAAHPVCPDVKPRLTKEQHDILEAHFQQQHKPSTTTKKGFAESLGVPLDKINNWFQNRRAKVKQDLKKQQGQFNVSLNMVPLPVNPQIHMPHMPQQSQPPQQDFYQQSIEISPQHLPMDGFAVQRAQDIVTSQVPTQEFNGHVLSSISESTQPASYDAVMQSLVNAGYPMQNQNSDSVSNGLPGQEHYLPWDHPEPPKFVTNNQHFDFASGFLASGNAFGDDLGEFGTDNLDYQMLSSSAPGSMPSTTPAASVSTDNSPYSTTHSLPQTSNGVNGVPSLPSGQSVWIEDPVAAPLNHREDSQESTVSSGRSVPPSSNTMWMPQHFRKPDMYQQSNTSSQTLMSSPPEQSDSQNYQLSQADFERPFTFSDEAFDRRDSPATILAQSMGNVELQPSDAEFKQPNQPSSLAARRQRPRPAALGAAALRSASYSGGMPTSPGASQTLNVDHTLRRIRSTGVVNGRIQKAMPGSAQRSPLSFTFAEAAASPKFAVQNSGYPTTTNGSAPTTSGSLAPPTPLTPSDTVGYGNVEGSGVVYSMPPSSAASFAASPPETPLSLAALFGQRVNMSNGSSAFKDTPPQSAPATQQCFSRSAYVPQNMMDTPTSMDFNPSMTQTCYRRPSLPDVGMSLGYDVSGPFAVPMVNADGNLQLAHPTQFSQDQSGYQKHPAMNFGHDMSGMMAGPVQPPNQPDFQVHEYSPPQVSGQGPGGRRQEAQPKSYTFANQTPGDFKA